MQCITIFADSQNASSHARDGSGHHRSRLGCRRNCRFIRWSECDEKRNFVMTLLLVQEVRLRQPPETPPLLRLVVEDYRACERVPRHPPHFAPSNPTPTISRRGSSDTYTFS